jgi:hypothetical protein
MAALPPEKQPALTNLISGCIGVVAKRISLLTTTFKTALGLTRPPIQ